MSIFTDMRRDMPFMLFVAAFVLACISLVTANIILLAVGLACAVIGNILEKREAKNAKDS